MKINSVAVVAFALVIGAGARPSLSKRYELHEKRDYPSRAWHKRGRVVSHALLPMKIGLKQQNLEKGYEYLLDVSHPDSPNYANHWTEEQVHEAFQPAIETVEAVKDWIADSGISRDDIIHSVNKGWLHFKATAAQAEELLKTEFFEHEHVATGKWSVGCSEYHLPSHIREHIDYVVPGVKHSRLTKRTLPKRGHGGFKRPFKKPVHDVFRPVTPMHGNLSDCFNLITPQCIQALYEIPEPPTEVAPGNAIGIFEEGDFYAQEDLNLFFANFTGNRIPNGTHPTLNSIDGGMAPVPLRQAGGESDLDFQLAYPIVYPQEIVLYQVDDIPVATFEVETEGFGNTFLDALDGSYCNFSAFGETGDAPFPIDPVYPDPHRGGFKGPTMCGTYKPTNVISVSYGEQEVDLPVNYQKRQCLEYMKLGLQGSSIFFASGDTGVAGFEGDPASAPNGCLGRNGTIFNPTNPNGCPFLTNVGATMIVPGNTPFQPESGAFAFFDNGTFLLTPGGGFSNIYPVPDYQQSAIDTYFTEHNPPYPFYELLDGFNESKVGNGIYNRIGHGIPDVSANGVFLGVYNRGVLGKFGGTSASSPIFASIVTRINDVRLLMGKKPIGFINPALYAHPEILNDITNGTNPGCGTQGFSAVKGWDPVTGLGTPNFPKMLEFFTALQ